MHNKIVNFLMGTFSIRIDLVQPVATRRVHWASLDLQCMLSADTALASSQLSSVLSFLSLCQPDSSSLLLHYLLHF